MIQKFFEIEIDRNGNVLSQEQKINDKLFLGGKINVGFDEAKQLQPLKIARVPHAVKRQGQFPVILLSLKDVKGSSYQIIESKLKEQIINVFKCHQYLVNSNQISAIEKQNFQKYLTNDIKIEKLHSSLLFLSRLLFEHFNQKVYILIDEYDTPINSAYLKLQGQKKEFENVLELFRGIFGACLKGNDNLERGVITGILRIAKANLFSDLNNLTEYTLLDKNFSKFYGFTEGEVSELLSKTPAKIDQYKIKKWYNGYNFGDQVIYNLSYPC